MVFSRKTGPLKIATFNINNINKRLDNLLAWLARAQPDVVCLQELKAEQGLGLSVKVCQSSITAAMLTFIVVSEIMEIA